MKITPDYVAEQEDCVRRNFAGYTNNLKDAVTLLRLNNLKSFVFGAKTILSVGSGAFEPVFLNATHALDVPIITETLLRAQKWAGEFLWGSCDKLPYKDKSFDVAVCSEVIEHLPDLETVRETFRELDRVALHWIVTTPTRDVQEPTHKFFFREYQLRALTENIPCIIEKQGLFFYIHNDKGKICN
jgi:hypothetical protein